MCCVKRTYNRDYLCSQDMVWQPFRWGKQSRVLRVITKKLRVPRSFRHKSSAFTAVLIHTHKHTHHNAKILHIANWKRALIPPPTRMNVVLPCQYVGIICACQHPPTLRPRRDGAPRHASPHSATDVVYSHAYQPTIDLPRIWEIWGPNLSSVLVFQMSTKFESQDSEIATEWELR